MADLNISLRQLLHLMVEKGASDLHISAGSAPRLRLDGQLVPMKIPPLNGVQTKQLCYSVMTEDQKVRFENDNECDMSFGIPNLSRFRANIYVQRNAVAGAFRGIPHKIKTADELGLPPVITEICGLPRGLVLVTGPTGSGKSTTLAAMIDKINRERREHIMTIEDPIEFLHPNRTCMINQREVGQDTHSFKKALKSVLRQDPDVVLIGEMRDLETIEAALTIAETGHLVFGTLHTNSALASINRIIDVFPAHQQSQIRAQLSFSLQAVLSQTLLARADGPGRALVQEVMIPNHAIRNLIREDKIHQIYSVMQMGQGKSGMQTLNQALYNLFARGIISKEAALSRSYEVGELVKMIQEGGNPMMAGQTSRQ